MLTVWIIIAVCTLLTIVLLFAGVASLCRGKLMQGGGRCIVGLLFGIAAVVGAGVSATLYTYQVLTATQPVAEVGLVQTGAAQFDATVTLPDGHSQVYALQGQSWMLSAQVLVWEGLPRWLGLAPRYRLAQLSAHYSNLQQERTAEHTVYDLTPAGSQWVHWLTKVPGVQNWVRTVEGSAVYMPMVNGAQYSVELTGTGLLAAPLNAVAKRAVF